VITIRHFHDDGVDRVADADNISDLVGTGLLWVDLIDATPDELACIQAEFALHHLAMEDVAKHGQRPKLEPYPTHAFLVAYSASLSEVDLFLGPSWIITVRARNSEGVAWEPVACESRFVRMVDGQPDLGHLLYVLLDEIVDGYFGALDHVEDTLEDLEDRVFSDGPPPDEKGIQRDLFEIRRDLLHFRRAVVPLREVIAAVLRREVPWVSVESLVLMQDVYDHVLRVVDQVDAQRELMGNAVDAHLAVISNRVNTVMKKLTAWGSIVFGATLIAGIYGMNFVHMPELDWAFGYPFALGTMLALSLGLYLMFKRRDWL
jgi:magnesium transporter